MTNPYSTEDHSIEHQLSGNFLDGGKYDETETIHTPDIQSPHLASPVADPTVLALIQRMQEMTIQALTTALASVGSPPVRPPTLPPIRTGTQGETDILLQFEAHVRAYDVPKLRWAAELRALLRGDLISILLTLPPDHATDYQALKSLLLTHMGMSQATRFARWFEPRLGPTETMA